MQNDIVPKACQLIMVVSAFEMDLCMRNAWKLLLKSREEGRIDNQFALLLDAPLDSLS